MSEDGFQLVARKKKGKGTANKRPCKRQQDRCSVDRDDDGDGGSDENLDSLIERIQNCSVELLCSPFYKNLSDNLKKTIESVKDIHDADHQKCVTVVCYGIGNFASCLIARYQLGLLLCIRQEFQIPSERIHLYDPMFSKTEIRALNSLGCSLITVNEEGKRRAEGLTIFLMLHCGKPMYNNLLWANWKARLLQNVIIVGNSFKNMELNIPHRIMEEEASYIIKILPYVTEVPLKNNFVHDDIFNNTSIHCFPACNLGEVQRTFWESSPEPIYEKDAEIILKKEATLETM